MFFSFILFFCFFPLFFYQIYLETFTPPILMTPVLILMKALSFCDLQSIVLIMRHINLENWICGACMLHSQVQNELLLGEAKKLMENNPQYFFFLQSLPNSWKGVERLYRLYPIVRKCWGPKLLPEGKKNNKIKQW